VKTYPSFIYQEGKIKTKETIVEGFENTPSALIGLYTGANTGKMVVNCKN
jgi:NADPH-dependent curcumin reductase CurA